MDLDLRQFFLRFQGICIEVRYNYKVLNFYAPPIVKFDCSSVTKLLNITDGQCQILGDLSGNNAVGEE